MSRKKLGVRRTNLVFAPGVDSENAQHQWQEASNVEHGIPQGDLLQGTEAASLQRFVPVDVQNGHHQHGRDGHCWFGEKGIVAKNGAGQWSSGEINECLVIAVLLR